MKTNRHYKSALLTGLLICSTLSSCVQTRQRLTDLTNPEKPSSIHRKDIEQGTEMVSTDSNSNGCPVSYWKLLTRTGSAVLLLASPFVVYGINQAIVFYSSTLGNRINHIGYSNYSLLFPSTSN